MASQYSIATVTVAYNSVQVLSKQLDALLRQSRHLDEIVVVNNASTDGTASMLSTKYPQVTVLNLPANAGVGGGFAAGLAYTALQKKHDWIWLLDDDSVPRDDALENLLQGLASRDGDGGSIGMLASLPIHPETRLSYPGLLWRQGWILPPSELTDEPTWFVDAVISSGSLIRREVVEKVGLPRADFFMDFVDFEYCLRARRSGYRILNVRESLLNHAIGNPRTVRILGYSRAWADHAPWREYYLSRNYTFTIWNYFPDVRSKVFVLRWLLRHATGILGFGKHKRACLKMMFMGFLDGRAGKLGIRFQGNACREAEEAVPRPVETRTALGERKQLSDP